MKLPEPVVVLGGGGFIGSHLVARLVSMGLEVSAVDIAFPDDHQEWFSEAFTLRTLDMLDADKALSAVAGARTVFHFAADMGGVGYFHSDADLGAAMRNGRMTLNVLEACEGRVERLVFAASACVYPVEVAGKVMTEEYIGVGTPDQLYGAEKLHGLRLCSKVAGARVVVLDTIYGPGSECEGPRAKFPASVAWKALLARKTGRLELWGDGTQVRNFLYVDDAVDRILAVAGGELYKGPVNITADNPATCRDIAAMCLRLVGAPNAEIATDESMPSGVAARHIAGWRYNALFGVPDELPYEEGFARLIHWLDR